MRLKCLRHCMNESYMCLQSRLPDTCKGHDKWERLARESQAYHPQCCTADAPPLSAVSIPPLQMVWQHYCRYVGSICLHSRSIADDQQ